MQKVPAALIFLLLVVGQLSSAPRLVVRVLEGQDAINNISRGAAYDPVVEVTTDTGEPVSGAVVTFTLPSFGPGAVFPDGGKSFVTQSGADGRAAVRGMVPNRVTGRFEIRVLANFGGETASAVIAQTNAAPAKMANKRSRTWIIVLGLAGGAAAAGAFAASSGGSSPRSAAAAPTATTPSGTITPGAPGFGPP